MHYPIASSAATIVLGIISFIGFGLLFASTAVRWHRYILIGEMPKHAWQPTLRKTTWSYIWTTIKLILAILIILIPVAIIMAMIAAVVINETGGLIVLTVVGFILNLFIYPFILRLSIVLPAAAVEKPLKFREALDASREMFSKIFVAALCINLFSFATNYIFSSILPFIIDNEFALSIIGTGLYLVVNWISLMVGIGILTVTYGHAIEKCGL